jgi:hypothetical protein
MFFLLNRASRLYASARENYEQAQVFDFAFLLIKAYHLGQIHHNW